MKCVQKRLTVDLSADASAGSRRQLFAVISPDQTFMVMWNRT